ncbi:hypothetical protein M5X11_12340 [Paenibacillus alginolyticus]|uniref:hypothetical protein n=1 Tax=Paenibacillus alginolyticus TaxID=59839 RepID=UPI000420FCD7|nr:hypothetical protein [Paenibacillus alginolyticus]MCY9665744.1 hypothetical protein [Paenibacillus alginolyticus]
MDIFMFILFGFMILFCIFVFFAKQRRDRNEPIFGWQRKQHLQETGQLTEGGKKKNAKDNGMETLKDLIGIEKIEYGIFRKKHNEFCVVVEADSVNYDLLSEGARQGIIMGYNSLFRVIKFPIQILGQAVTQDLRKEELRFKENLSKANEHVRDYNNRVIKHIKNKSEVEFRVTRKVYYVIPFVPQPSKMGSLTPEKRDDMIRSNLHQRAWTIISMIRQCEIEARVLDSLKAMEVVKRAINRDRMLAHPIDSVVEDEKLSSYVTWDFTTVPGYEDLVNNVEEVRTVVENIVEEEEERERADRFVAAGGE